MPPENNNAKTHHFNRKNNRKKQDPAKKTPVAKEAVAAAPPKEGSQQTKPRNSKSRHRRQRSGQSQNELKFKKFIYEPVCPVCGQIIKDAVTAIGFGRQGEAVHFDCVLKELAKRETLAADEKIIYIGGGSFAVAVLPEKKRNNSRKFEIKKKIDLEEPSLKELIEEWRKNLAIAPAFVVAVEKTTIQMKEEEEEAKNELL